MPDDEPEFEALLRALVEGGVDFVVVGGVAAVLQGAPVSTFDLDVVYSRDPQNLTRLEAVLRELAAHYREKPAVQPTASLLDSPGHHLLMTESGPLDLLGSTVRNQGYPELVEHTDELEIGDGTQIRVLDLPALIRMKEALGRDRDRAVLPILRRTLQQRGEGPDEPSRTSGA